MGEMRTQEKRYVRYQKRCQSFVAGHTCLLILQILGVGLYGFLVIAPSSYIILASTERYGARFLFLLVIPLIFMVFAVITILGIKQYAQAVFAVLMGDKEVKAGYVRQRSNNRYTIEGMLPQTVRPASYPHLTRPTQFHIRRRDCERDFQVGDHIMVVYPRSRALNVYSSRQIRAIYAFSNENPTNIPELLVGGARKRAAVRYVALTALVSVLLLSVLGWLTSLLLRQVVFL
ncbi:MAG: hypothetical protein HFF18_11205 [Oscillospiraceae bacterium]|nr:hypothetical protein [Oscillospiraceae bacterium]